MQPTLFADNSRRAVKPFKTQLLKWIGNKQRFAHEIVSYFPRQFGTYYEPFIGSGAVLATLVPDMAVGSDVFKPLAEIWKALKERPDELKRWYTERWEQTKTEPKEVVYEKVKASFNSGPNGPDLLYLCRTCYGGVVRFRKKDGFMSTPCGVHNPIPPASFTMRADEWFIRCKNTDFICSDFAEVMDTAKSGGQIKRK